MFSSRLSRLFCAALLVCAPLALLLAGCSKSATEPTPDDLKIFEIIVQDDGGNVMYTHHGHWHGAPVVPASGSTRLTLWFFPEQMGPDDHDAPPREKWLSLAGKAEYDVRAVVEDPTIATWSGDRTGGQLAGVREGASRISFVLRRGTTTVYEAPPLNFRVIAGK
jgi:hypothetical protein